MTDERTDNGTPQGVDQGAAADPLEKLPAWWQLLPREVAALLLMLRPPMSEKEEIDAFKSMVSALVKARGSIPSIPLDQNVHYVSKRTNDVVDYDFASLHSIHNEITKPLAENGLFITSLTCPEMIVVVVLHEDGGMMPSWMELTPQSDLKETAAQIKMLRRYLTVQLLCLSDDTESGERDISENARSRNAKRLEERREARQQARRGNQPPQDRGGRRPQQQQQQRPAARPAAGQGGARPRPASGVQSSHRATHAANAELQNHIDAALAQLPAAKATELREKHKDRPNELLRAAQEAVRKQEPAVGAEARGSDRNEDVEDRIKRGIQALGLGMPEERALRSEFIGRPPEELLTHIQELYRSTERPADNDGNAR